MPHVKCNNCHHEWDQARGTHRVCEWCDCDSVTVLEERTGLEAMLSSPDYHRCVHCDEVRHWEDVVCVSSTLDRFAGIFDYACFGGCKPRGYTV